MAGDESDDDDMDAPEPVKVPHPSNFTVTRSNELDKFATAFAKFQGEVENAKKSSNNPMFKSKYADLAEILDTAREPLAKNGLSLLQFPAFEDGIVYVTSVVLHESGQFMAGTCSAPAPKVNVQGVGGGITYIRRYAAAAILGIAQEDDDGNTTATGKTPPPKKAESKRSIAEWRTLIDSSSTVAELEAHGAELKTEPNDVKSSVAKYYSEKKASLGLSGGKSGGG